MAQYTEAAFSLYFRYDPRGITVQYLQPSSFLTFSELTLCEGGEEVGGWAVVQL